MYALSKLRVPCGALRGILRVTQMRHGSVVYRGAAQPSRKQYWKGEILAGAMWFWILWRFYHEPDDVFGHTAWPDASKWTDEELGVPADDED